MPTQVDNATIRRTLRWGSREIPYRLRFSEDHSRLAITVHPDLSVAVVAPVGRTVDDVVECVQRRAKWISGHLRAFERWHPLPLPRRYISGETHRYLGRQYRLKVQRGPAGVSLSAGRLMVTQPRTASAALVKGALESWYVDRAREVFARRLLTIVQEAPRLAVPETPLRLRRMATRWGSCSARGTITLNPELVKAPIGCIDYVIIHELCHRKVPDHSRRFFKLLSATMPDWERRRDRLNALR